MTSTTTSTVCSPSFWHTPWPVVPGWPAHRTRPKSSTWEPTQSSLWTCRWTWSIYKYYFRAKRSVTGMPISQRLHWLQTKDVEERSAWMGVTIPRVCNEPGPGHWRSLRSLHIQGCALVGTWTSHTWQEDGSTDSGITSESCEGTPQYISIEVGQVDQWQAGGNSYEGWHQAMPAVPARRVQSQALSPGGPSVCGSAQEGQGLWGPHRHELHHQASTTPRRGGGCLFWVRWVRAARGATSYGRPYGGPQRPPYQSLHQLWMALLDGGLASGPEPWSSRWEEAAVP